MVRLTRRQFGGGAVAAAVASQLPVPVSATPTFATANLKRPVRDAIKAFKQAHKALMLTERDYGAKSRLPEWADAYCDLIASHCLLAQELTDDTPQTRQVAAWSDRLAPKPCRQAQEFWKPLERLSPDFVPLQSKMLDARAAAAIATYRFWKAYPHGDPLNDDMKAFYALYGPLDNSDRDWHTARNLVLDQVVQTQDDRELARRAVYGFMSDDVIDLPLLKRAIPDWQPRITDIPELRRCAFDCPDCEKLLGPRQRYESDTEDA